MTLKDLQDKHQGQMGFVVGTSPSLHFQNVEPLKDYPVIAVNSGILKVPNAQYFLSDDIGAKHWNYYQQTAKDSKCIKLLYEDKLKNEASHFRQEEVVFFKHKWWFSPPNKYNLPDGLLLTKDAELPIVGARTSAGSAVHFAYIMGCNPIVLLGCDCCYGTGNKRYFWQFPGEKKAFRMNGEPVFSSPNNGKKNGKPVDAHCVSFIEYWEKFAEVNKGLVNIIYASEGGLLKCFPSMSLVQVLEDFND